MRTAKLMCFACLLLFALFSLKGQVANEGFVKVKGSHFEINENPYYFLGANFWHGAYLGAELVKGDRERLIKELDLLASIGITNLRIMASSEESSLDNTVKPVFQSLPGVYNENLLQGLDFLLSEMEKRKMKAVLVLNNYWQWSGGMQEYSNWTVNPSAKDQKAPSGWREYTFYLARFYNSSDANALFRKYISTLVNRKNIYSGVLYKNDPAIMAWQLANEPRPAPDAATNPENSKIYINWIHETAKYIDSLDKNHLISSGSEGTMGSCGSDEIYTSAHSSPYIDYLTVHIWPKNWRWYDATDPQKTFEPAKEKTVNYFTHHISIAQKLEKPIVLEEFGLERDNGSFSPGSATSYRDNYLEMILKMVVDSIKASSPLAGLNYWTWSGVALPTHSNFKWRQGDPFMGDPPQEPKGLNSIFSTDTTTIDIFKKYNREIDKLMK